MAIPQPGPVTLSLNDPIRIVPLHLPKDLTVHTAAVPAVAAAQLTYRGGPLLTAVKLVTLFWGSDWQQAANAQIASDINTFFQFIVASPLIDQLAEYSVPQYPIGYGSFVGSSTITDSSPAGSVTDADLQQFLQQQISAQPTLPQPDSNTLYFIYLPPGVVVVQGGASSCQAFCGYHDNINGQIFYAPMPYPNCNGCLGGLAPFDALTATSSHELCEAITDPIPGQGWYDDANGEIGDICAWQFKQLGQYTVQAEWSNNANQCV